MKHLIEGLGISHLKLLINLNIIKSGIKHRYHLPVVFQLHIHTSYNLFSDAEISLWKQSFSFHSWVPGRVHQQEPLEIGGQKRDKKGINPSCFSFFSLDHPVMTLPLSGNSFLQHSKNSFFSISAEIPADSGCSPRCQK